MDTSETYIKMCRKAMEIQAIAPEMSTRIHVWGNICICSAYDKGLGGFFWCMDHFDEDSLGNNILVSIDSVWLPRQDQLQEMVQLGAESAWGLQVRFMEWFEAIEKEPLRGWSMEQLWLAFVMKEKYGKTWNGEDWVT